MIIDRIRNTMGCFTLVGFGLAVIGGFGWLIRLYAVTLTCAELQDEGLGVALHAVVSECQLNEQETIVEENLLGVPQAFYIPLLPVGAPSSTPRFVVRVESLDELDFEAREFEVWVPNLIEASDDAEDLADALAIDEEPTQLRVESESGLMALIGLGLMVVLGGLLVVTGGGDDDDDEDLLE